MKATLITGLAKDAKRNGFTLQWSMAPLGEKVERAEQRRAALSKLYTKAFDADTQVLRLENEAFALVLAAVLRSYPVGADITFE
jgi:hypothetical protein